MMSTKLPVRRKVAAVDASLDQLERELEPLLSQSLPETLLGLETIQQAKLQTLIPYLLYDLVFIYLKTKGIDPRTHPVISELERVKQYFDKIAKAEKQPEARKQAIDKAAAGRFIKHAIAQAKSAVSSSAQDDPVPPADSSSAARVEVKVTSKMRARAEYEKELKEGREESGDEDGGLEVFDAEMEIVGDEEVSQAATETVTNAPSSKSSGKQKAKDTPSEPAAGNKRRRPAFDPFTGTRIHEESEASQPQSSAKKTKKRKAALESDDAPLASTSPTPNADAAKNMVPSHNGSTATTPPEASENASPSKTPKKKKKKAKKERNSKGE
ncbi:hypothetical protein EYR40_003573 [Pleurotus pulmonarius]|nr:hypothetical protein EYR40_003573 [Pleurotus pulmonarius]KAF4606290.1 hypothetical protein EYR38_000343 [Pleurotus pulmonarius]